MTTFSKFNFKTLNYNAFRPHYPALFYRILADYATQNGTTPVHKAVDLGCGTGVATYPLLNFSEKVTGVDLSAKMIDTANLLVEERLTQLQILDTKRINFVVGSVESLAYKKQGADSLFGNGDLDLITAAQCIHWFKDYPTFFESIAKLLKSGGTLAYWYYIDPIVVDYSGSDKDTKEVKQHKLKRSWEIVSKYLYDDPNFAGPHWEQPGRSIIRDHLDVVNENIPKDLFTDITNNKFIADVGKVFIPDDNKDLKIVMKNLPMDAIRDYHSTGSGYHNYREAAGEKAINIPEQILKDWEDELGWTSETTADFVFHTGYTFMRKK